MVPCGENCLFGTDGVSTICYDCALESINTKDLTMVDKLCQFLDIAFMAEEWIKISKTSDNERYILETYIKTVKSSEYSKSSWKQYDLLWEKAREVTLFVTKTGKYAVKRNDKMKPSRYFTTVDRAREWITEKYEADNIVENL